MFVVRHAHKNASGILALVSLPAYVISASFLKFFNKIHLRLKKHKNTFKFTKKSIMYYMYVIIYYMYYVIRLQQK